MDFVAGQQALAETPLAGKYRAITVLVCLGAGMAGGIWGWPVACAPLVIGIALTCIFKPDWGLYFLVGAMFFPYAMTNRPIFYPADVILFLVVIGFWLQRAREGKTGLIRTPLDLPIALWLGIMALSLVNAYDLTRGIINWLRHVQLFLLFYTVAHIGLPRRSERMIGILVGISAIFALTNSMAFLQTGGTERIFGVARVSLSGTLTMCAAYLISRACFAKNRTGMYLCLLLLGVILFGQIANQSRGALGFTAVGMGVALYITWWWARRNTQTIPCRRAINLAVGGTILVALLVLMMIPILKNVVERFMGVGNAALTLDYRFFLWSTAWHMYLDHPLLGIGLGQVQVWHHISPELRLYPLGVLTFGLGAHNTLFKYLAETGTVGIIALTWFMCRTVRLGIAALKNTPPKAQIGHIIGLWAMVFTIVIRSLVEGDTFYAIAGITTVLMLGFSLHTIMNRKTDTSINYA